MKVFISHKKEDSYTANRIANELRAMQIDYYLDLLDFSVTRSGKELTDHIKANLNDCTDIIVVISEKTRYSQWVPFEVGMSAQIDMPTATFLQADVNLPEFLEYWPRLKYPDDIQKYVTVRKRTELKMRLRQDSYELSARKKQEVAEFYADLKKELR